MLQFRHLSCVASLVVTTWLCMVIISIQMTGQDGSQPMTLLPVRKYYNFNGFPTKTMFYRNMWILRLDDGSCKWYSEEQTPSVPYSKKMRKICTDYHHSISFLCPGSRARISPAPAPVRGSVQPSPAPAPFAPPPPVPGSVRPEPVVCKKKKGTCQHTVAFGSHYDRSAFQGYQDYLSGQHATTRLPDKV